MRKFLHSIQQYWQFALTVLVGVCALIISFGFGLNQITQWSVSIYVLIIALMLFGDMIKTLKSGNYGIDILAITAIIATVFVNQYWASLIIVLMLTGGETLEDYAASRARRELTDLIKRAPQIAHLIKNNEPVDIDIYKVKTNDILLVRPHEVIPVDGELLSDIAEIDESSLTGEALPVTKKSGDKILSGALNGQSAIEIRAIATAKNSQYEQIIKLVREAESNPAPFVRLADRYAVPFTLFAYIIAGAAWAVSGDAVRFAEVLVVASPCPLILAAPIALISGMSHASRHGIIVKSGAVLEKVASAKTFAFDKTGTLTRGEVVVDEIVPAGKLGAKAIAQIAASAEVGSSHILASSLVSYAKNKRIQLHPAQNVREMTGDGIFATVDDSKILVGRREFLEKNKIKNVPTQAGSSDGTVIFIAVDSEYAGAIYFTDKVRPESRQMISELKKLGVQETAMLTGDRIETANRIAKEVGVDKIFASLLPADKVKIIRKYVKENQNVVMVGDGVNDAPVLAAASVGVAMGARGSTAASESADAVIMPDDIGRVAMLRQISTRTMSVALQSVWTGIGLCAVLMVIAAFGKIPALLGAGLQELIDVTVIFNALRAHRSGHGR